VLLLASSSVRAQDEPTEPGPPASEGEEPIEVTVRGRERTKMKEPRAGSRVERRDMQERLPRSAPDALRFEPGVFVQQTAHSQASAFVRGRTGQQTVLLFDGIRLNTSTFRQGPNQYFFTVDSHTVHHIDVQRGGASTRWGSDAIGGVIHAHPIEPRLDLMREGPILRPRTMVGYGSSDHSFGERFQLDTQVQRDVRILSGIGYRRVGNLRSGGAVRSPTTGQIPQVPALGEDGRTQLGTGFDEVTGDGRIVLQLDRSTRLVAAAYAYRQYDAPRTDLCPPPYAPRGECLRYDEQFRTLTYAAVDTSHGAWARKLRATLSFQRQHERRSNERPASFVENGGRDDVDTIGLTIAGETEPLSAGPTRTTLQYGGDLYHDRVDSTAWTVFADLPAVIPSSRGLYLSGSHYTHGGLFVAPTVALGERWEARAGARFAGVQAHAPADPESGTVGVDRGWTTVVGNAGLSFRPIETVALSTNVDRSFRAPNLDDLTSRQQTGPGFQFENASLSPEKATTVELGAQVFTSDVEAEVWVFRSAVGDAITRVPRDATACPPSTPQCEASWTRFQLDNAAGHATVQGLELSGRIFLPEDILIAGTFSATHGDMANPQPRPSDPALAYEERVPLSRIPPMNGTAELRWRPRQGPYAGAALRWARMQSRLAPSDLSDPRIPEGGTPGFAVVDLLAGYRLRREVLLSVVLENVGDTAYRYHGSAVNGPGRGVLINFESGM
jgi:iron complex outermembrane receptor protein/hemoglobin/transferrin/lactoferrin receptor protein